MLLFSFYILLIILYKYHIVVLLSDIDVKVRMKEARKLLI